MSEAASEMASTTHVCLRSRVPAADMRVMRTCCPRRRHLRCGRRVRASSSVSPRSSVSLSGARITLAFRGSSLWTLLVCPWFASSACLAAIHGFLLEYQWRLVPGDSSLRPCVWDVLLLSLLSVICVGYNARCLREGTWLTVWRASLMDLLGALGHGEGWDGGCSICVVESEKM